MDRYGKTIVRLIIVVVVIVAAVLYSRTGMSPAENSPATNTSTDGSGLTVTPGQDTAPELKVTPTTSAGTVEGVTMENGMVTVTAVRGNGLTHMARRAVAEYLSTRGTQGVTAEHKIYIEDYLRKHATAGSIHIGSQISFSETDIQHAIELSLKLSEGQLNNLHQYSVRVPNL